MTKLGISARKAASLAGMSDARWRHIVNGYQPIARNEQIAVTAPAQTLARMAKVVGVDADQLRAAGREDAADELERLPTDDASQALGDEMEQASASAVLRVIATVLRSNLPDGMKLRLIERELAGVEAAVDVDVDGPDAEGRRATG